MTGEKIILCTSLKKSKWSNPGSYGLVSLTFFPVKIVTQVLLEIFLGIQGNQSNWE